MADVHVQKTVAENEVPPPPPQAEEVVVVPDVTQADEKTPIVVAKESLMVPEKDDEEPVKLKLVEEEETTEMVKPKGGDEKVEKVPQSGSFKEESSRVADLLENEKKALEEFKNLVQEALNKHEFYGVEKTEQPEAAAEQDKTEVAVAAAVTEEPAKEEPKEEVPVTDEPKVETEAEKETVAKAIIDEPAKEENVIEEKVAADAAVSVEAAEDDGAKTVEAIEETIVSVSSSVQPEQSPADGKADDAVAEDQTKEAKTEEKVLPSEEVSIWGIPLLADERSDVFLLKFLRARDFKVKDAFAMLKNTIRWRKEFGIDELVEQDLGGDDLEKVVFMHGFDKEGHPVCYNVYGEFQSKELYQKTFSDEEKRQNFLRWRIQFLEKSIRKLDFSPGGICTIVQVNDLKNSPGPAKWELRQATKQALQLLQDNYPEFVARQVFINVPWWYLAVNKMISPFLTQRTKSKFVFSGPSKSAETLFRFIAAEQVPVKYGGLSKDGEFANTDAVTEITVKPSAKHTVEFPVTEACLLAWEVRVVGWDVSYGAEFVPTAEDSYTVIIQKARKIGSSEEPVVCNNFKVGEAGKVVLTINNPTSKKKKLLYRLKTKPTSSD